MKITPKLPNKENENLTSKDGCVKYKTCETQGFMQTYNTGWAGNEEHWDLEDLFETKEEADWENEFGNITRTETLRLPNWEEFQNILRKKGRVDIYFYDTNKQQHALWITMVQICVVDFFSDGSYGGTDEPLTKENYTEACRLCKKLFLGN